MIFCLSQIHTGTNSVLAWLADHEDCDGVLLSTGVYQSKQEPATVYHEHVRPDSRFGKQMCRSQIVMAWAHPTIIPLRDPLAALVSYQHRAEHSKRIGTDLFLPREDVVDRWCLLAETEDRFEGSDNIHWLPWDLAHVSAQKNPASYKASLWEIAKAIGFRDQAPSKAGLPCVNGSGEYWLKTVYEAGDLAGLAAEIGDKGLWYLQSKTEILRPFLERRGYANLLWWS